jgi:nitronate monooxygenase
LCGDNAILPFPIQNALSRALRTEAAKQGKAEYLSLWAGQGVRLARSQTAGNLVRALAAEIETAADQIRHR